MSKLFQKKWEVHQRKKIFRVQPPSRINIYQYIYQKIYIYISLSLSISSVYIYIFIFIYIICLYIYISLSLSISSVYISIYLYLSISSVYISISLYLSISSVYISISLYLSISSVYISTLDIQGRLKQCYFKKAYYSKCRNGLSWGPLFPLKHYHSENSATHRCFLTHRCANACPNHCVLDLNLVFPGSLVPHTPCNPVKPLSLEHR